MAVLRGSGWSRGELLVATLGGACFAQGSEGLCVPPQAGAGAWADSARRDCPASPGQGTGRLGDPLCGHQPEDLAANNIRVGAT